MAGLSPFSNQKLMARTLLCRRGGRDVFEDLSFELRSGDVMVISGPNGSGKSSLLRMVAGLVEPAEGELTYQEGDEDAYHFEPKGGLHYVGHLPGLKAVETLRETLEGWSGLYDLTPNIEGSLELFGLDNLADIQTKYLSEGQKRRLGLSRLIAIPKLLWLLDEPNAGLDKTSLKALYQLISDHRSGGGMVMIASHVEVGVDDVKVLDLSFPREGAS